ncbi:hypothetical protein AHF37_05738 [Paragonimus kellicotti]|nr:hypothetical protein AHF37_05738 [Paragonimus kellicotti]
MQSWGLFDIEMTDDMCPEHSHKRVWGIQILHGKNSSRGIFIGAFMITVGMIAVSTSVTTYLSTRSNDLYSKNLQNRTFKIDPLSAMFLKDGEGFQFISGSIHYFRIPQIYWTDRLYKAKALGLDVVQM